MKPSKAPMVPLNARVPKAVKIRLETLAGQGGKKLSNFAREILARAADPKRAATMADLSKSAVPRWSSEAIHRAHLSVFFRIEIQQEQIIDLLTRGWAQGTAQGVSRSLLEAVEQLDGIASTLVELRDAMLRDAPKGPAR
jgi:hypothetical protein